MSRFVILKTGSTFSDLALRCGDFEDWVATGITVPKDRMLVIDAQSTAELPLSPEAVIITGAHEMVTDRDSWIERAANWLHSIFKSNVPIFGICFGHQLLARALGGEVGDHPQGREVGMVSIRCLPEARNDPLMSGMPSSFPAYATHTQSVLTLPPGATRLAGSAFDPNHAVRFGERQWGVQFHPEFSESVIRYYIDGQRDELLKQGQDADRLIGAVGPSPSSSVMERFAQLAFGPRAPL
jgi:GMP synthase (glutamine-hydrolysing)